LKHTPQEQLADELTRYFNFEAAPNDKSNNEPSVLSWTDSQSYKSSPCVIPLVNPL
jgi:hypothetical protein